MSEMGVGYMNRETVSKMGGRHVSGPHGEEADGNAWALTLNEDPLHKYKVNSQQENNSDPDLM